MDQFDDDTRAYLESIAADEAVDDAEMRDILASFECSDIDAMLKILRSSNTNASHTSAVSSDSSAANARTTTGNASLHDDGKLTKRSIFDAIATEDEKKARAEAENPTLDAINTENATKSDPKDGKKGNNARSRKNRKQKNRKHSGGESNSPQKGTVSDAGADGSAILPDNFVHDADLDNEEDAWAMVGTDQASEMARLHSKELSLRGLALNRGDKELLKNAWLKLIPGHRYGLVGANGCGKTTLMRHMAAGKILGFPKSLRVRLVEQEQHASDENAIDLMLAESKARLEQLESQLEALETGDEALTDAEVDYMQVLVEQIDELSSDKSGRVEAARMLRGMGFSERYQKLPVAQLSGGWRMRVALARALFAAPDLLMLDEPNNFLDLPGILWLQNFLTTAANTEHMIVLVTSHNRAFLDAVCTYIVAFANKQLAYHPGNLSSYMEKAEERMAERARTAEQNEKKKKQLTEQIDRLKKQGANSKRDGSSNKGMISSRQKKLERVGHWTSIKDLPTTWASARHEFLIWGEAARVFIGFAADESIQTTMGAFRFPAPPTLPQSAPFVSLENVAFAYPDMDAPLFEGVTLCIDNDRARVAVLGANGMGKTTLLRVLAGELAPTKGERKENRMATIGYFSQHAVQDLPLDKSALAYMRQCFNPTAAALAEGQESGTAVRTLDDVASVANASGDASDDALRKSLAVTGLKGDICLQPIRTLSGGQKARVVLAQLAHSAPHVLILDEVTAHLDYPSIEVLIDAINDFEGGVVVVSHDQYFVQSLNISAMYTASGKRGICRYEDSYESYLASLQSK